MKTISEKPAVRKRVRIVSARITDVEYQALQKRRKDAGVSMSRYVRSALLSAKVVQRISRADAEVLRKLAGEANNINQLAVKANSLGFVDAPQLKKEAERWHKFQADVERTFLRPDKSDMKWQ